MLLLVEIHLVGQLKASVGVLYSINLNQRLSSVRDRVSRHIEIASWNKNLVVFPIGCVVVDLVWSDDTL